MTDTTAHTDWVNMLAAIPDIHVTDTADTGKFSYSYASLPSILAKVRPVLAEHGFAMTQAVTTVDGKPAVETLFDHTSGYARAFGPLTIPGGNTAQTIGSAITYARRYSLIAALGIAPDNDDDGAAASRPEPAQPVAKSPTDQAWSYVYNLFPDTAKQVWFKLHDNLGLDELVALSAAQAKDLMAAADKLGTP